ncbi:hypothetical protein D3C71_2033390 [compost metagenome]
MRVIRVLYGLAALMWAADLVRYWFGNCEPTAADISFGFIALVLVLAGAALKKTEE